jgi:hypothetical protein
MSSHLTELDITRKRGDNFPFQFTLTDSSGTAIDITGFTFRMVVDPSPVPEDALSNIFDLAGIITDAVGGVFEIRPTTGDMDITPGVYFYEVQMIDAGSNVRTIVAGQFAVEQDIVK